MIHETEYIEDELQQATVEDLISILGNQLATILSRQKESKTGHGYDVKLRLDPTRWDDGTALFMQFKRAEVVATSIVSSKAVLTPQCRFALKTKAKDANNPQHSELLTLNADHPCRVYYVTCGLASKALLESAKMAGLLLHHLFCIHPSEVGSPPTTGAHHVHFNFEPLAFAYLSPLIQPGLVTWQNELLKGYNGVGMLNNALSHLEAAGSVNFEAHTLVNTIIESMGGPDRLSKAQLAAWQQSLRSEEYLGILQLLAEQVLGAKVVFITKEPKDAPH